MTDELEDMPDDTIVSTPGDMWLQGRPQYMDKHLICCTEDPSEFESIVSRSAFLRGLK